MAADVLAATGDPSIRCIDLIARVWLAYHLGRRPIRRQIATLLFIFVLATPLVALAQDTEPVVLTSLEPIGQILNSFAAGDDIDGLTIVNDEDPGAAIAAQFQFFVNLSSVPSELRNFLGGLVPEEVDDDIEVLPVGLVTEPDAALAVLERQFGDALVRGSFVPPFDPWSSEFEGVDLTPILDGWSAYDKDGLISGSVGVLSKAHSVWGIELAEPFDESCPTTFSVGRAWMGVSSRNGPDPLFTEDALSAHFPGNTHSALADEASRTVELTCRDGSPRVEGAVMEGAEIIASSGATVALVKGNAVVFISGIEVLTADLEQTFYATPTGGGAVEVSKAEDDLKVLLPNPYGPDDIQITIDLGGAAEAGATGTGSHAETLLHRPGTSTAVRSQSDSSESTSPPSCTLTAQEFFLLQNIRSIQDAFIVPGWSIGGFALSELSGGTTTFTAQYRHDRSEKIILDRGDGSATAFITTKGNTCELTGTYTSSYPLPMSLGGAESSDDPDGDGGGDTADDPETSEGDGVAAGSTDDTTPTTTTTTGGAGGVPWVPIGIALVLLAGVTAYGVTRSRSSKNCDSERQAYAAAEAAYGPAKKASDFYEAEYNHWQSTYNDLKWKSESRSREPHRVHGYPEGPDGDREYAEDQKEWEQLEADADRAERDLDGTREGLEVARAERDEAAAALETAGEALRAARVALMNCQGSAQAADDDTESGDGSEDGDPGSPGTFVPPPDVKTPQPDCLEGTTKVKIENQKEFTILNGPVQVNVPTSTWAGASDRGAIEPTDLTELDETDLMDLFDDLDKRSAAVPISVAIPTSLLTVKCIRIVVCSGGKWIETDQTNRVEEVADGPNISFRGKAKDKKLAARLVAKAQAKIVELQAEESASTAFGCD